MEKRLFSYAELNGEPEETTHTALSPYLIDASRLTNRHAVVVRATEPAPGFPTMRVGTKPVDGGHYIFSQEERDAFVSMEPGSERAMRPFIGGYEHLNGIKRFILHAADLTVTEQRALPGVMSRIAAVRDYRAKATGAIAKSLSQSPPEYHVTVVPTAPFLGLAEVSSERREYSPVGYFAPPSIPSNQLLVINDAELWLFAMLSSAAQMGWLKYFGGRLKSDFRYSTGLVYNTFPWPDLDDKAKAARALTGQAHLDARANHPGATLADLYDPDAMPPDLRRAHKANDAAVDRLYRRKPFDSERERVEFLFARYEALRAPLMAKQKKR